MLYDSKRLGGAHANLCISGIAIKILIRSPPRTKKEAAPSFWHSPLYLGEDRSGIVNAISVPPTFLSPLFFPHEYIDGSAFEVPVFTYLVLQVSAVGLLDPLWQVAEEYECRDVGFA